MPIHCNPHYDGLATGFYDKLVFSGYLTQPGRRFNATHDKDGNLVLTHLPDGGQVTYSPKLDNEGNELATISVRGETAREVEELTDILVNGAQAYGRLGSEERRLKEKWQQVKHNRETGNF